MAVNRPPRSRRAGRDGRWRPARRVTRVAQARLIRACGQVVTPNGRSGSRSAGSGWVTHQLAFAERAHQQDSDTELVGQRQDRGLDLAVGGVVGHLDAVDAAAAHEVGELPEGRRRVVGSADQADQSPVPGGLEHRQLVGPGDQGMDLRKVDPATVPVHRAVQLGRAVLRRTRSGLVGDDNPVAPALRAAPSSRSASPYIGAMSMSRTAAMAAPTSWAPCRRLRRPPAAARCPAQPPARSAGPA